MANLQICIIINLPPQSIVSKYDYLYDKDLWEHIKKETSGDFRTALKGLVLTEARFLAEEMRNAMVMFPLLTL